MVSQAEFGFAAAETAAFEAQLALESREFQKADEFAYRAMIEAATTLLRTELLDVPQNTDLIVREFRTRFVDTKLFVDKYMGNTFSNFLFTRYETHPIRFTEDYARQIADEASLFNEAARACYTKIQANAAGNIKLPVLPELPKV